MAATHHSMPARPEYGVANLSDFNHDSYLRGITSSTSSPSPVMWQLPTPYNDHVEDIRYEPYQESVLYPFFDPLQAPPVVEFTDLTAPYNEDGRRRRTHTKDRQAISSMHMRRRAQNRASQRAFRERKEKHAQDLQTQLDELNASHKVLQRSYEELESVNRRLVTEIEGLKTKDLPAQTSHIVNEGSREATLPKSMTDPLQSEERLRKETLNYPEHFMKL